jgi:F-type H+-transporting ATPase subunit a
MSWHPAGFQELKGFGNKILKPTFAPLFPKGGTSKKNCAPMQKIFLLSCFVVCFQWSALAQEHGVEHQQQAVHGQPAAPAAETSHDSLASGEHGACGGGHEAHEFNPGATAFHHISDQNIYSIGPWHFPLPCIFYIPGQGWEFFSSSRFEGDAHGNGRKAYNGFVLVEGSARRVVDAGFPKGEIELGEHVFVVEAEKDTATGKDRDVIYVCFEGQKYRCDNKSTADGGLLKGGITSFYDFSITKNVATMLIVFLLLGWLFFAIAKAYKTRDGQAPKGIQSFLEPVFLFMQDEVVKPFLGPKWEKYQPFLMSLFFFILGLNLFGQVPFFGGSNVTGNLSVTLVLAVIAFLVVNLSGNGHYWKHTLWMPGVPPLLKIFILTPVEILGLFMKPLTLMLRLFGNITAGHMVIVIFVGLIFIFGQNGTNPGAALGTSIGSVLLTLFMMAIELLVAFLQAFVFTILTASYIGAATEQEHH